MRIALVLVLQKMFFVIDCHIPKIEEINPRDRKRRTYEFINAVGIDEQNKPKDALGKNESSRQPFAVGRGLPNGVLSPTMKKFFTGGKYNVKKDFAHKASTERT